MNNRTLALAAVIIVLLAFAASMLPRAANSVFSAKDASDAALKDTGQFVLDNYGRVEKYAQVVSLQNDSGKWKVTVELTINPHAPCPTMQRLSYEMHPIIRRNESMVSSSDCHGRPITNAPEAIIDSYAASEKVRQLAFEGARACAFRVPLAAADPEYCAFANETGLRAFSSKNALSEGDWLVQWTGKPKEDYFIALEQTGKIIAQSG